MDYYSKYIKYKLKYLALKDKIWNQKAGSYDLFTKTIPRLDTVEKIESLNTQITEEQVNYIHDKKNIIYYLLTSYVKNRKPEIIEPFKVLINTVMNKYTIINSKLIYDNLIQLLFNKYLKELRPIIMLKEIFYLQLMNIKKYEIDDLNIDDNPPTETTSSQESRRIRPPRILSPEERRRSDESTIRRIQHRNREYNIRINASRIRNIGVRNIRRNNPMVPNTRMRQLLSTLNTVREDQRFLEIWMSLSLRTKRMAFYFMTENTRIRLRRLIQPYTYNQYELFSDNLERIYGPAIRREARAPEATEAIEVPEATEENIDDFNNYYYDSDSDDLIGGTKFEQDEIFDLYGYLTEKVLQDDKLVYDNLIKFLPMDNASLMQKLELSDKRDVKPTFNAKSIEDKKVILKEYFIAYLNEFKFVFDEGKKLDEITYISKSDLYNLYNEMLILISLIVEYFNITEGINSLFKKIDDDFNFTNDAKNMSWIYKLPSTLLPKELPPPTKFISNIYNPENILKINDLTNSLLYNLLHCPNLPDFESVIWLDDKYKRYFNCFGHLPIVVYTLLAIKKNITDKDKIDQDLEVLLPENIELLRQKDINGIPNYFYLILFHRHKFRNPISLSRFNENTIRGEFIKLSGERKDNIDDFIYKIIGSEYNIDGGRRDRNIDFVVKRFEQGYPLILQCLYRDMTFLEREIDREAIGISYYNSPGIDASGLTKDFYTNLSKCISSNIFTDEFDSKTFVRFNQLYSENNSYSYYLKTIELEKIEQIISTIKNAIRENIDIKDNLVNLFKINKQIEKLFPRKNNVLLRLFGDPTLSVKDLETKITLIDTMLSSNNLDDVKEFISTNQLNERVTEDKLTQFMETFIIDKPKSFDKIKNMFEYNIYPEFIIKNIIEKSIKKKVNYIYIPISPIFFGYIGNVENLIIDKFTKTINEYINARDEFVCALPVLEAKDNKYAALINNYLREIRKNVELQKEPKLETESQEEFDTKQTKIKNRIKYIYRIILEVYVLGFENTDLFEIFLNISNEENKRIPFYQYILTINFEPDKVVNSIKFSIPNQQIETEFKELLKELISNRETGIEAYMSISNAWFAQNNFPAEPSMSNPFVSNPSVSIYPPSERLPQSHTCSNTLDLPNYFGLPGLTDEEKKQKLREKFLTFVTNAVGFQMG
jgi:hypothetical protein